MGIKEIIIESTDFSSSNSYVDFVYDNISYRWYLNENKFSKLYYLPGDYSRAVRGKEREAVFEKLKTLVEEMKPKSNVINFEEFLKKLQRKMSTNRLPNTLPN